MVPRRSWATVVGAVLAVAACLGARGGAEEVEAMAAPLLELAKRNPSAYLSCDAELTVGPFGTAHMPFEVWARDRQHYWLQEAHGSVITVTPEAVVLYVSEPSAMVRIPASVAPDLEPRLQRLLALLGCGSPEASLSLLEEFADELTRSGECVVGDVPCWTFSAGPGMQETTGDALSLFCFGPWQADVTLLEVALERQTAMPRRMHLDAILTSPEGFAVNVLLDLTVREIELDVDVTDDMLIFAPPADTPVIEWTAETPVDELSVFLFGTVQAALGQAPTAP